ncbi:hypothetical protein AU210_016383 [Fusarium oxysporum f. sp. radicis-cucumerinum]|uniref:Uncharacterized protein n=1 Tax=Fusarium oxysporum f. sp. radicis-cucumerinum TaxID=327505 RepID=A0A2H3FSV1_FUSOX|nr:hypothetical protein AU210_016383 [Fusarium oxysporum f. sp. radicis-cucumerinum]
MKSLKDPWDIFKALKYLGNRPGEAMGLCLLVLDAQIPWLYLEREDGSDTETESDEMETESEDGSEDDGGDESENDSYTNDCSMPSLDNLGFIDIQPQLEDAETEMLKLIWSITSCKRRYYGQEGSTMPHRILTAKGTKLFFVDSKRPSLRHQMLNAVANGLTPEQKQFIHLILVFWAKVEVIELANDLLQKQPSPEQERILHFLGNSKELFNPEEGEWLDKAIRVHYQH